MQMFAGMQQQPEPTIQMSLPGKRQLPLLPPPKPEAPASLNVNAAVDSPVKAEPANNLGEADSLVKILPAVSSAASSRSTVSEIAAEIAAEVAAARATPKAAGKSKAAKAKETAKGKATGKPEGKAKPKCKPTVSVEKTRSQVCARTGLPGPGQNKTFKYVGTQVESAKVQARRWLKHTLKEHGIEY